MIFVVEAGNIRTFGFLALKTRIESTSRTKLAAAVGRAGAATESGVCARAEIGKSSDKASKKRDGMEKNLAGLGIWWVTTPGPSFVRGRGWSKRARI